MQFRDVTESLKTIVYHCDGKKSRKSEVQNFQNRERMDPAGKSRMKNDDGFLL